MGSPIRWTRYIKEEYLKNKTNKKQEGFLFLRIKELVVLGKSRNYLDFHAEIFFILNYVWRRHHTQLIAQVDKEIPAFSPDSCHAYFN